MVKQVKSLISLSAILYSINQGNLIVVPINVNKAKCLKCVKCVANRFILQNRI